MNFDKAAPVSLLKQTAARAARKANTGGLSANIMAAVDHSGSMMHLYRNGQVAALMKRVLVLAMSVDDDGKVPTFVFHDSCRRVSDLTENNLDSVMAEFDQVGWGGTRYAPALQQVYDATKLSGFFSKTAANKPTVLLYFTDGDNFPDDKNPTRDLLIKMSKECPVFVKFFAIRNPGEGQLVFLESMDNMTGRPFDNADVQELRANMTDEELFDAFYDEMLPSFAAMKKLGLIK